MVSITSAGWQIAAELQQMPKDFLYKRTQERRMKNDQKKLSEEENLVPKSFDDKSPIGIRLDLGKIIDGLHLDFVVIKGAENRSSFMVLAIEDEAIGFFDMEWSDHVLPGDGMLCMHAKLLGKYTGKK